MAHLVLSGVDHVENPQRRLVLVGRIDLDNQFTVGHGLDLLGDTVDRITEDWKICRPGHGELPFDHLLLWSGWFCNFRRSGLLTACRK